MYEMSDDSADFPRTLHQHQQCRCNCRITDFKKAPMLLGAYIAPILIMLLNFQIYTTIALSQG